MKTRYRYLLVACMLLASTAAKAQNATLWKDSYALEAAGKYAQAASALEPLLRESPTHEFGLMRRAWLNYLQGRLTESLRDYNQVLFVNSSSLEARLGLTLPLLAQHRWSDAAYEARRVLAVSAWDYTAHLRLLMAEEGEKRWDDMARHAAAVVARYPSDPSLLVYLARAEAWRGNVKAARTAYAQVLERSPGHVEAANYLKSQ